MTKRILVVDDDQSILESIQIILSDEGYQVDLLSDGDQIISQITQSPPDMILLDIWMRGTDGGEIVKILKSNPQTQAIPVVLVSALNQASQITQASGANDLLSKPFDLDALLQIVVKYTS